MSSLTEFDIRQAKRAADMLQRMLDEQQNYKDGFDSFAQECIRAVGTLKLLEWDAIRRERFPLTPSGLFAELVNNAETLLTRQADEAERRQEWLAADQQEEEGGDVVVIPSRADKFGCDPDRFTKKTGRKPANFARAVKIAGWVHIDEMRSSALVCLVYV